MKEDIKKYVLVLLFMVLFVNLIYFLIPVYKEATQNRTDIIENYESLVNISQNGSYSLEGKLEVKEKSHLFFSFNFYEYLGSNNEYNPSLQMTFEYISLGHFEGNTYLNEMLIIPILKNDLYVRIAFIGEDYNLHSLPYFVISISIFTSFIDEKYFELYSFQINSIYMKKPSIADPISFNNTATNSIIDTNEGIFIQRGELLILLIPTELYELETMLIPILFALSIFFYVLPNEVISIKTKKELMKWTYSVFLISIIFNNFTASFSVQLLISIPPAIFGFLAYFTSYLDSKKTLSPKISKHFFILLWFLNSLIFEMLYEGYLILTSFFVLLLLCLILFQRDINIKERIRRDNLRFYLEFPDGTIREMTVTLIMGLIGMCFEIIWIMFKLPFIPFSYFTILSFILGHIIDRCIEKKRKIKNNSD